jgi:hypothetical protein
MTQTIESAREFAYNTPSPSKAQWRARILQTEDEVAIDYLVDLSPYASLRGVKAAETRAKNHQAKIDTLKSILINHDYMKGCYFWRAPRSAWQRRKLEEENSIDLDLVINGQKLVIRQETSVSAKHVYYSLSVHVDGKKKDVRAVKKALAQIKG